LTSKTAVARTILGFATVTANSAALQSEKNQELLDVLALRFRRQVRPAALVIRLRRKAFIFIRKTLQVRPRDQQCISIAKLAEKDLCFSMKMMFEPGIKAPVQPA
jgi:hypothetical protein